MSRRIAAVGRNFAVNRIEKVAGGVELLVRPHVHEDVPYSIRLTRIEAVSLATALLVAARISLTIGPLDGSSLP